MGTLLDQIESDVSYNPPGSVFDSEALKRAMEQIEKLGPPPLRNPWQALANNCGFDLDNGDMCVVSEGGVKILSAMLSEWGGEIPLHKNVHVSRYAPEEITFIRKPEPPEIFAGIDLAVPGGDHSVLTCMTSPWYGVVTRRQAMGWPEFLSNYPVVRRENFWSCDGVGMSRSPAVVYALRQKKYVDINCGTEYPGMAMMTLMGS